MLLLDNPNGNRDEPLKLQMTKEQVASLKEQIDAYNAVEQPVYVNTFYPSCLHMNLIVMPIYTV